MIRSFEYLYMIFHKLIIRSVFEIWSLFLMLECDIRFLHISYFLDSISNNGEIYKNSTHCFILSIYPHLFSQLIIDFFCIFAGSSSPSKVDPRGLTFGLALLGSHHRGQLQVSEVEDVEKGQSGVQAKYGVNHRQYTK
jgi:hypothetical protein